MFRHDPQIISVTQGIRFPGAKYGFLLCLFFVLLISV